MKTALDCLPCLLKQALYTARLASDRPDLHVNIMEHIAGLLPRLDFGISPPENAVAIYRAISRISENPDPFLALKKESNDFAMGLLSRISTEVTSSTDPLLTAIKFAIAGNIIDYGSHHDFDVEESLEKSRSIHIDQDDYQHFREALAHADRILYLADNCGELVFDRLLIETIGKKTVLAVKQSPIINDATMVDAQTCGLGSCCKVISNGTDCPGTSLDQCSKEFREHFHKAPLIISKGQGNFETLSEAEAPLFFLLTVKCQVVAQHIKDRFGRDAALGDMLLLSAGQ